MVFILSFLAHPNLIWCSLQCLYFSGSQLTTTGVGTYSGSKWTLGKCPVDNTGDWYGSSWARWDGAGTSKYNGPHYQVTRGKMFDPDLCCITMEAQTVFKWITCVGLFAFKRPNLTLPSCTTRNKNAVKES
jgi:hypothetical protein